MIGTSRSLALSRCSSNSEVNFTSHVQFDQLYSLSGQNASLAHAHLFSAQDIVAAVSLDEQLPKLVD